MLVYFFILSFTSIAKQRVPYEFGIFFFFLSFIYMNRKTANSL